MCTHTHSHSLINNNNNMCLPDTAVLAANSSILPGGVDVHVVQGGLAYGVVRAGELHSLICLGTRGQD